jgi:hypothetical protein
MSVIWIWTLSLSGALCAGFFVYRYLWHRRYRRKLPAGVERLEGQVMARQGRTLVVEDAEGAQRVVVLPESGQARPRPGDAVTVEGEPVRLEQDECLYRQAVPDSRGLSARRLVLGRWPRLRWMQLPVALACLLWLLSLNRVLFPTHPAGPLFDSGSDRAQSAERR